MLNVEFGLPDSKLKTTHLKLTYFCPKIMHLLIEPTNQNLKHEINACEISIFTVQYSPDRRYLVSGNRDAHLKGLGHQF